MIETVVWDLGGVLLDWDPRHLYRQVFDDPAEMDRFLAEVCTWEWHHRHDAGVPFAVSIPELTELHPDHRDHIRLWEERYLDMIAGEIDGSVALVRELHGCGLRQLALTNMPLEVDALLRDRFDWFVLFEGVVVSGAEQVVKPDPRIYEILIERFGVDPSTTAFVDDREENVASARALGFHAIVFTDAVALGDELRTLSG